MKIAILGSWFKGIDRNRWECRLTTQDLKDACHSLGRELSTRGQSVIVTGDDSKTADLYVVEGIIEEMTSTNKQPAYPLVNVVRSAVKRPFEQQAAAFPKLFSFYSTAQSWWEGIYINALKEANAVLTIGGGKGTHVAGMASIIAQKRIVPIASFGGASEKLLSYLEAILDPATKEQIRKLRGPWGQVTLETTLNLMGITETPKVLIIHGRSQDWSDLKKLLQNKLKLPEPAVMEHEFFGIETLTEKFEEIASTVDAAIAVATPDDLGAFALDPGLKPRARQNIWLEIGWFWGRLGRRRIMILCRERIEMPSDLEGIEMCFYEEKPSERVRQITAFLEKIKSGS